MGVVRAILTLMALTRRVRSQAARRTVGRRPVIPIPAPALLLTLGRLEKGLRLARPLPSRPGAARLSLPTSPPLKKQRLQPRTAKRLLDCQLLDHRL